MYEMYVWNLGFPSYSPYAFLLVRNWLANWSQTVIDNSELTWNYPVIMLHNKLFLDNDFRNKHNYWE